MTIMNGILKDSWDHYRRVEAKIKSRLQDLPKGSLYKRRIGKQVYYYLSVRKGERIRSKYLGKEEPDQVKKAIEERRLLLKQRKEVRQNLKLLSKTLKKKQHG